MRTLALLVTLAVATGPGEELGGREQGGPLGFSRSEQGDPHEPLSFLSTIAGLWPLRMGRDWRLEGSTPVPRWDGRSALRWGKVGGHPQRGVSCTMAL